MGGEKGLWVVEMRHIWTATLMFSKSAYFFKQSSHEGPKMHDVNTICANTVIYDTFHKIVSKQPT